MFGGLSLSPGGAELPREIAHIGRDPFDPEFDLADVVTRLRRRNTLIKRALLDQRLVPTFDAVRDLVREPVAARLPALGPVELDLGVYDRLLATTHG